MNELKEQMSLQVVHAADSASRKLERAEGVVKKIQFSTGIVSVLVHGVIHFFWIETGVNIDDRSASWIELPGEIKPRGVENNEIFDAFLKARQACLADDRDKILQIARELYRCDCADSCKSPSSAKNFCQRMFRIRDLLMEFAKMKNQDLPHRWMVDAVRDYLTP